ncbi:MAG TPA: efflux transporter outer membrane subunit [Rhizomicrobium sp.]|nr:efflux transporter outer membrane subunit [Rhizomicrobium sp.]
MGLLAGCTVGPDFHAPQAPAVTGYVRGDDAGAAASAPQFSTAASLAPDWWRLFESPVLNEAVQKGLEASPTIAAAKASLQQAQDELRSGQGVLLPQVSVDASAVRQQASSAASPLHIQQGTFNLFSLSGGVSYLLDIFGGERRAVEALGAAVDYQQNIARAASLTLASNIADTVIAIAAYRAEIAATNETVKSEQGLVWLAHAQALAGTGSYAAEMSLKAQMEATQAELPGLEQQLAKAEHLLAVLEGHLPAQMPPMAIAFDDIALPRTLPVSLPSDLVRQRPDILQAEASLHAASAEIGVQTAAMLPSITLSGTAGYSATSSNALFSGQSGLWSLGAGITQPIFNGGTLWYRRQAARDAYDVADAQYRQTVLAAFQQVADSLRALQHDATALAARQQALDTSRRARALAEANYKAGLSGYSELLLADSQLHQAEIAWVQAKAAQYQDTVALFASLGGGWWNISTGPEKISAMH